MTDHGRVPPPHAGGRSSSLGLTSLWALITANAIPLVCAVALGWELAPLLALYWAESAVIGVVTMLRLLANRTAPWKAKLVALPMFALHFGVFMFVHGTFLGAALGDDGFAASSGAEIGPASLLPFLDAPGMTWTLVALLGSHLWSFAVHDLAGGERDTVPLPKQMFRPYGRIIVMHVTLLVGLGVMKMVGDSWGLAAVFAVIKTVADAIAHRRVHRGDHQGVMLEHADGATGSRNDQVTVAASDGAEPESTGPV